MFHSLIQQFQRTQPVGLMGAPIVKLCLILGFTVISVLTAHPTLAGQDGSEFPGDSEISLLVTQAERAFDTYGETIKQEEVDLGKQGVEGARRDRQVLDRAEEYLPKLKANPQAFNSAAGFLLVIDLDDASRNMAVCMGQAGMTAGASGILGNTRAGESKLILAQACLGASNLLYAASENAVSLYERYLLSNSTLQQKETEAITKCSDILEQRSAPKAQP